MAFVASDVRTICSKGVQIMSHPGSNEPPKKENTANFDNDALKRAPKRPRNSKRPMSKTIGLGIKSTLQSDKEVPRMKESELWKALDGAMTKASEEQTADSAKKSTSLQKFDTKTKAAPSKKSAHRTQLGMPAISPIAPSKPKPIPVQKKEKSAAKTPSTSPKEAFMKTIAQAPMAKDEPSFLADEGFTETLSAEDLLEYEEEESTLSTNETSEKAAVDAGDDADARYISVEPEPQSVPPDANPTEPIAAEETTKSDTEEGSVQTGIMLSPVETEKTSEESAPSPNETIAAEVASIEVDSIPPLEDVRTNGRKRLILFGALAATILGGLAAAAFFYLPTTGAESTAPPSSSAAEAPKEGGKGSPKALSAAVAAATVGQAQSPPVAPSDAVPETNKPSSSGPEASSQAASAPQGDRAPAENPIDAKASPVKDNPVEADNPSDNASTPVAEKSEKSKKADNIGDAEDESEKISDVQSNAEPVTPGNTEMVTITLNGIPTGAAVTVDGKTVKRQFTVPKSKRSIKVVVKRTGFKTTVKRIIPGRDKQIRVRMSRQ